MALSTSLGMNAIAEGVETQEQLEQMKLLNCEFYQGFLFSRPLDPEDTRRLLITGL
jgi:EAL domain-containing protein (putative c-di-GMP-specific phosphodiesterase class I)